MPIADVDVGDQVLASTPGTGETQVRTVTDTITSSGPKALVGLTVLAGGTGDRITAIDNHRFWAQHQRQWVMAADLEPGDQLRASDGGTITIAAVNAFTQRQTVHNLTVAGMHSYYVGGGENPDNGVLAHNCGDPATVSDDVIDTRVLPRHGPGSPATGSKSVDEIDPDDYAQMANDAVAGSPTPARRDPDTGNHLHIHEFSSVVGTTESGKKTKKMAVWVNARGEVTTMHPAN